MINFRKAKFVKSATNRTECPNDLSEIVFIGKSNVGKSSLINALCDNKGLAFTSSKPGHTRLLNYFLIDSQFYLVDAPGYGYSAAGQKHTMIFGDMMEDYFGGKEQIRCVVFLLDSRRELNNDDFDFYEFLIENNIPYIICMTKCDKLNQSEKAKMMKVINTSLPNLDKSNLFFTSCKDQRSLDCLK